MYSSDLGTLSDEQLVEYYVKTKQKIAEYHNTQMALKILLNSGYGATSNMHFRWYSDDIAESVTLSGQLAARWIIQHINRFMNTRFKTTGVDYIVATDTDSVHINVEPYIREVHGDVEPDHETKMSTLEAFSKDLDRIIGEGYDLLSEELNVFDKAMHMKLETMSRAVWSGKKHYAMEVWSNEGIRYDPPKMKYVGLEVVKSSTPQMIRDWMKRIIALIIDNNEDGVKAALEDYWQTYSKLKFEQMASPRTCNHMYKYYDPVTIYGKKCPPHVRGALLYNKMVVDLGLDKELRLIQSGDKVRYSYMLLPNPIREDIFACPDDLPEQLHLDAFIDYRTQFDKTFGEPMTKFARVSGMKMSDTQDVSNFF